MTKDGTPAAADEPVAPQPSSAKADSYSGPVVDAFLHTPWIGDDDPQDPRGDTFEWSADPRLQRVMRTFARTDADGRPSARLTASQLLDDMDAAGVDRGVLAAKAYYATSERGVQALHRRMHDVVLRSAGRLKAVATLVPPELGPGTYWDVMQNVRVLREAHAEHAVIGVHVTPAPWGMPPSHKWFYPAYATCAELGLALFVHVGMPGPLWPMGHQDPAHLDEVALAFPTLRIVAHHIGDPWTSVAVRLAARHPNLYICTSAWSPKRYPAELVHFMQSGWHDTDGSRKVLFASDHPLLDMSRATRDARRLPLSTRALANVLHDNAARLFWDSPAP